MWPFRKYPAKLNESQQAIVDAIQKLKRVQEQGPEVSAVSLRLKDIRERNHFAEQLQTIMERRYRVF